MKRGLLMSGGGLDSLSVVALYHQHLGGIADVDYGNKGAYGESEANEWAARKYGLQYHHIQAVPYQVFGLHNHPLLKGGDDNPLREGEDIHTAIARNTLEVRNLYIAAHVITLGLVGGYDGMMTGFHKEHVSRPSPDATPEFFNALREVTRTATDVPFEFRAPFQEQGLERIGILAQSLRADPDVFKRGFNCYQSMTTKWCGECTHCVQRLIWAARLRDEHGIIVEWPKHSDWAHKVPAPGTYVQNP